MSKIAIGVSIPVMIIVGLSFGLQMYDTSGLENIQTEEFDISKQEIAWNIIKSYKGADDEGSNLLDTIITQTENAYPNEKILKHNDTILEISVQDIREQKGVGFYEVKFTFQTYDDVRGYIWYVNIETEEIIPINSGASHMMNIVDFSD